MIITEILSKEHQHILSVVKLLEKKCSLADKEKELQIDFFQKVITFIREYADKFHHGKEEEILFTELCKESTNMHCDPTPQMRYEHDLGRGFVKEMEEGLNVGDKKKVIFNASGYIQLIREHIYKEDNILYPMAEEALTEKEKEEMRLKFKEMDERNRKYGEKGIKIIGELS